MPDIVGGLPHIYSIQKPKKDPQVSLAGHRAGQRASSSPVPFDRIQSAFGIALHMHQPMIPAQDNVDLRDAAIISNLQYMMQHQHIGDNHNAPVFLWCYSRISDFVRELVASGRNPRVMLDYSGCLLWGLQQMGELRVLDNLKLVTSDKRYHRYVEWLGTTWSHAVVTSTPVPDIGLHIAAWRAHFESIFGSEALERVKGFSAPEMHLPIHPDVFYEYIKTLKDAGYEWLMVQEHTIENTDGTGLRRQYFPHRLVAKNSMGRTCEIVALIKTQGSDTKLVGQMQPCYEARSKGRDEYSGKSLAPYVLQIADGENGGVMMNEFPHMFNRVFHEIGTEGVIGMNGSEYLECVRRSGVKEEDFIPVQPILQHRIWNEMKEYAPGAADRAIEKIREKDQQFNLDRGSWTNDKNWVKGYKSVLDPINSLSVLFHERFDREKDPDNPRYKKALLYLLLSQTSCFRYWGEGLWTDYAREICRRGLECLKSS